MPGWGEAPPCGDITRKGGAILLENTDRSPLVRSAQDPLLSADSPPLHPCPHTVTEASVHRAGPALVTAGHDVPVSGKLGRNLYGLRGTSQT